MDISCAVHPKSDAIAYCPVDNIFYCSKCFGKHKAHNPEDIEEYSLRILTPIAPLKLMSATIAKYRLIIDHLFQKLEDSIDRQLKQIMAKLPGKPSGEISIDKDAILKNERIEKIFDSMVSMITKSIETLNEKDSSNTVARIESPSNPLVMEAHTFQFDQIHSHNVMSVLNNGQTIKRMLNENFNGDVPIYANMCIIKGIATWKVNVDKCRDCVGVGIHSNNTDVVNVFSEHFVFSRGAAYGMRGECRFYEGDILTVCVNMEEKWVSISGPSFSLYSNVRESKYYPCFQIHCAGDQLTIVSFEQCGQ